MHHQLENESAAQKFIGRFSKITEKSQEKNYINRNHINPGIDWVTDWSNRLKKEVNSIRQFVMNPTM